MANIIELEASYHLDENYDDILKNIGRQGFKFFYDIVKDYQR